MDKTTEMFIQLLTKDCEAWEQEARWAEYIPVNRQLERATLSLRER
jgi:hypothetical protein